jgi:hypothetical protein
VAHAWRRVERHHVSPAESLLFSLEAGGAIGDEIAEEKKG